MKKWKDSGENFDTLEELINADIVIFNGRTMNKYFVRNQQVQFLLKHFNSFTKAMPLHNAIENIVNETKNEN